MNAVQRIKAKTGATSHTARAAPPSDEDADKIAPVSDEAVEDAPAHHAPPPPGMGKLVDRTV